MTLLIYKNSSKGNIVGVVLEMNLKYSILMSVYYNENPEYLEQAIDSMLCQTYSADQYVIVEDGKLTDDLYAVLNKYSDEYPDLITRIKLEKNCGLGVALDEGLKFCRNDLVARMDSDDISFPDRCIKEIKLFEETPKLSIVSGFISEFTDKPEHVVSIRTVPEKQEAIKKRMRTRSAFNHPAVMYRKSEVIRCGGYGMLKRKQDHDLFSRMMNRGCLAYNLQEPVLFFRAGVDSIKRRKSWENCKSYMAAQREIFRRKECSFYELLYVYLAQFFFFLAPKGIIVFITKHLLREKEKL